MASRRDLFQSYQFMVQRVISGIVLRETDPLQTPLRKMIGSGFASFMIAAVALGGATLIGFFFPSGNTKWQDANAVIVEKETGANYVYLPDAGGGQLLHPTENFVSAALLVGTTETVTVGQISLVDVPRGPRLGVQDVPTTIPDPDRMLGSPWTLCSLPAVVDSGERVPITALVVGQNIDEGSGSGVERTAVLVRDIELDTLHMVWNGHQYPIPGEAQEAVLEGLTIRDEPQIEVGTAWLNAVPSGRELRPFPVEGRGEGSSALAGAIVGEVRYVESPGGRQYYQVARSQIIEITEVQASVLLGDPGIKNDVYGGQPPRELELSAAEANLTPRDQLGDADPTDPPADVPEMAEVTEQEPTICASFQDEEVTPHVVIEAEITGAENATATQRRTELGTVLADRVLVGAGYGAVVEEQSSAEAPPGNRYLITDEGRRYLLPTREVQDMLGYGAVEVIALPASLIQRIPSGNALDPIAARQAIG